MLFVLYSCNSFTAHKAHSARDWVGESRTSVGGQGIVSTYYCWSTKFALSLGSSEPSFGPTGCTAADRPDCRAGRELLAALD